MSSFNSNYSKLYDEIHVNKNYTSDIEKLLSLIEVVPNLPEKPRILDFGCGTGKHLKVLSSLGFEVQGYDPSEFMLLKAQTSFPEIPFTGDLQALAANYDVVISLFDVMSYQVTDESISLFLDQIFSKVKGNGAIILDFWNLDGVRRDPPQNRSRVFEAFGTEYERIVSPTFDKHSGVTELEIKIKNATTSAVIYADNHLIRAFDSKEIEEMVGNRGKVVSMFDASDYKTGVTEITWRVVVIIRPVL